MVQCKLWVRAALPFAAPHFRRIQGFRAGLVPGKILLHSDNPCGSTSMDTLTGTLDIEDPSCFKVPRTMGSMVFGFTKVMWFSSNSINTRTIVLLVGGGALTMAQRANKG